MVVGSLLTERLYSTGTHDCHRIVSGIIAFYGSLLKLLPLAFVVDHMLLDGVKLSADEASHAAAQQAPAHQGLIDTLLASVNTTYLLWGCSS